MQVIHAIQRDITASPIIHVQYLFHVVKSSSFDVKPKSTLTQHSTTIVQQLLKLHSRVMSYMVRVLLNCCNNIRNFSHILWWCKYLVAFHFYPHFLLHLFLQLHFLQSSSSYKNNNNINKLSLSDTSLKRRSKCARKVRKGVIKLKNKNCLK